MMAALRQMRGENNAAGEPANEVQEEEHPHHASSGKADASGGDSIFAEIDDEDRNLSRARVAAGPALRPEGFESSSEGDDNGSFSFIFLQLLFGVLNDSITCGLRIYIVV